jgi:hypothetical protein
MEIVMRQMVMMTAVLGTLGLLGACGPSTPPPPKPEIKVQGEAQKQLASASEMNRMIGLKRAVHDSGHYCKRIIGSNALAPWKNLQAWQADCDDGKSWTVFVAANGVAQVSSCDDAKELKLPLCRAPAKDPNPGKKMAGAKPAA